MSAALDVIRNAQGERLDVAYQAPPGFPSPPDSVVVIAHGVTAHKDRPLLMALADALSEAGLASLRVSFAGNGGSEGRFEDAVPSKEVGDLGSVIDALVAWGVGRIAYAGHSMGGAVGVMRASIDPRIACLVSLAGMVHVDAFMRAQFGHLTPGDADAGQARVSVVAEPGRGCRPHRIGHRAGGPDPRAVAAGPRRSRRAGAVPGRARRA